MQHKYSYSFVLFFIVFFTNYLFGQNRIENEFILQLKSGTKVDDVLYSLRRGGVLTGKIKKKEISRPPYNFWKISLDRNILPEAVNKINTNPNVVNVQYNHTVSYRNTPDDSLFFRQWSLNNSGQAGGQNDADIDADLAWDLTTGGLSPSGDTIVICIIDNGIDTSHVDLVDNMWKNYGEIRGNGIDDDGNGYVDDYLGWNTYFDTDEIAGGSHGTPVSGIIGAKGNNHIGISGINWNVKLMMIVNGDDEAGIIGAYLYALKMRKLYNETGGQKGAYIVATNASLGIDNAKAEDHPIWCSIYDSLGVAGILNVGATSNNLVDVDIMGDMPSSCPSDYLLTVTNVDQYNQKVNSAGYGIRTIDLGAYGKSTYSTHNISNYGSFGGTSAATPHATGVAGLLFSYSDKLNEISHSNPSNAALMAKDALMNGVVHNGSLEGISVSEGVLNAYNALKELEKYDDTCAPPVEIRIDSISGDMVVFSWDDYNPDLKYNLIYKSETGESKTLENVTSPYTLTGLDYCSEYNLKLQTICDTFYSKQGFSFNVKTIGCCESPKLTFYNINDDKLHLEWENKLAADEYQIISKYWSFPKWDTITTTENNLDLDYDFSCGKYIVDIQSICGDNVSDPHTAELLGDSCEDCSNIVYCTPSMDNEFEWIDKFSIGYFVFKSGKDNNGYGKFDHSPAITLVENRMTSIKINLGFRSEIYNDYVYVWVDFNKDGTFQKDEIIFNDTSGSLTEVKKIIELKDSFDVGFTTLRVMVSAYEVSDLCDVSSGNFGEYEDYCIYLDKDYCDVDQITIDSINIDTTSAKFSWSNPYNYDYFRLLLDDPKTPHLFHYVDFVQDTSYTFGNLEKCSDYRFIIVPYCLPYKSGYTNSYSFKTRCTNAVIDESVQNILFYPNPVNDILNIDTGDDTESTRIEIFDLFGKKIFSKNYNGSNMKIDLSNMFFPGMYIMKIEKHNFIQTAKIIKQ